MINKRIKQIIAIDNTVRKSLTDNLKVCVIHNSFSSGSTNSGAIDKPVSAFGKTNPMKVGFIGNLLKLKGIFEYIEAARICKERGLYVNFIIVGFIPKSSKSIIKLILKKFKIIQDSTDEILLLIDRYQINDVVKLIPFASEIAKYYSDFDLLCFPSHLNAAGRPVIEAAFKKVPSIVAFRNYDDSDIIMNDVTGICVEEKNPISLANAIEFLYNHPEKIVEMGINAFLLANNQFDARKNSDKILKIYNEILGINK